MRLVIIEVTIGLYEKRSIKNSIAQSRVYFISNAEITKCNEVVVLIDQEA